MRRITEPQKWKDTWFLSLTPAEKLTFIYLTENCDEAGFYEINLSLMSVGTGITPNEIKKIMSGIRKCFIHNKLDDKNKTVTKIWLKKFLFHQEMLPLDLSIPEQKKAYWLIKNNLELFNNDPEMLSIIQDFSARNQKAKPHIFQPPQFEEFAAYYREIGENNEEQIKGLYDHYMSCGWKVGKNAKKMDDWKAAVRNAMRRNLQNSTTGQRGKSGNGRMTKVDIITQSERQEYINIDQYNNTGNDTNTTD